MVLNGSPKTDTFTLNRDKLHIVDCYKHLGVTLTSKNVPIVSNVFFLDRAKFKAAIIRKHGFHEDGLRIDTAIKLYKMIIRPLLEYGSQTLNFQLG